MALVTNTPSTDEAGRTAGRPRDERASRAITDAALRQLSEMGFANMSMESVAAEAGVARATIYRRYRDKADLVTAAIAQDAVADLAKGPSADPKADVIAFVREFDNRAGNYCIEVLGSILGAHATPGALELHRDRVIFPRTRYARSLLEQARGRGEFRADADLDVALQMLAGAVLARHVNGVARDEHWVERAVEAIWIGMGPPHTER
jgi:AcrR family transcriptional regulator